MGCSDDHQEGRAFMLRGIGGGGCRRSPGEMKPRGSGIPISHNQSIIHSGVTSATSTASSVRRLTHSLIPTDIQRQRAVSSNLSTYPPPTFPLRMSPPPSSSLHPAKTSSTLKDLNSLSPNGSIRSPADSEPPPAYDSPPPARSPASSSSSVPFPSENSLGLSMAAAVNRQRAATTTGYQRTRARSDAGVTAVPVERERATTISARSSPRISRGTSDYSGHRNPRSVQIDPSILDIPDESTPLLGSTKTRSIRSISVSSQNRENKGSTHGYAQRPNHWRHMLRAPSMIGPGITLGGMAQGGEGNGGTRQRSRKHWAIRYMRPLWSKKHWKALFHLIFLNFPFVLLVWPFLFVGTVTGTILLIVVPLGILTWFLTLLLARSASRLELVMQVYFHSPLPSQVPPPVYHPIFRRIKTVASPRGSIRALVAVQGDLETGQEAEVLWEKNLLKNGWAMFVDHLSYQYLTYLILTKALITLLSTIVILVVLPISFALIVPFPYALELVRRFGRWQAGVAVSALQ